ncbi:MAG: M16 family metallopeptidase [Shimia sp.]
MKRLIAALILLAAPAAAEIDITEVTTPGGIDAWLVEEHAIPFVALELRFRGGASLDEPGKRGATYLMTGMFDEGAGDLDARAFRTRAEDLAAQFSFRVFDDTLTVSAKMLTENLDESVELLRLALTDPRFDADAVERVRQQVLSGIRSDATDPDEISSRRFMEMAFGDHPYGTAFQGTTESVEALTADDLRTAHRNALARDRVFVGAVGDITEARLGEVLDTVLGGLPETGAPQPDRVDFALEGGITVVEVDTPQSTALFGHEGIERDDEDYFAAYILNHVLGGSGLESTLSKEVREARGLTYGISSFLVPKDLSTMVLGRVRSENGRIAEAIEVTREVWADTAANGLSAEELAEAKTFLTGAYPLRFDGNETIANILAGMQQIGLPADYVNFRNDRIRAVTLEEIDRVASELLDPEGLHFVVAGQPEGLTASK